MSVIDQTIQDTNVIYNNTINIHQTMQLIRVLGGERVLSTEPNESQRLLDALTLLNMSQQMIEEHAKERKRSIQTSIIECNDTYTYECSICYEEVPKNLFVKINCGHQFCKDCMKQHIQNSLNPTCAFCRTEMTNLELSSQEMRNEFDMLLIHT
jgi:hypothetical protein